MAGLYFESVSCCYCPLKKISKKFLEFFLENFSLKVKTVCVILYNYLFTFLTHIQTICCLFFAFLCRYDGYPTFLPKILFDPKRFFFPEKHCSKKNYLDCTLVEKKT